MDNRPDTVTVPTELGRADPFWDFTVLATAALLAAWLIEHGVPWPMLLLALVPLAVWTLTGEGAADIPYIGSVAAGLRSKFGLRRAHEWLLAWSHYFQVAVWPVWRARCEEWYRWCRRQITDLHRQLSARTAWTHLPAYSWGYLFRFSLLRRRVK